VEEVRRHLFIGLLLGLTAFLFSLTPPGDLLELKGYDLLHSVRHNSSQPTEIVLVIIDEPSFAELRLQWPWPRSLHARLIDRLTEAGASVIGLDILFSEPSQPNEDRALTEAIRRAGSVVLASDISVSGNATFQQEMVIEPIAALRDNAVTGLVTVPLDRDFVVRRFYPARSAERLFAEQIALLHTKKKTSIPTGAYIHFSGRPNSIPAVSYYQALDPSHYLPRDFFKGKTVLVGRATAASPEPDKGLADYFATPFLSSMKDRLMSGVELHAVMAGNVMQGLFVMRAGAFILIPLFLFLGLSASLLQLRWQPLRSAIAALLGSIFYVGFIYYAFTMQRIWLPTSAALIPFVLSYAGFGAQAYLQSERKKQQIKKAFSKYLSPSVLKSVLADPDNMKLGGEKIEATILFSDIAGFTTISEKCEPEEISRLINTYMTAMTSIILKYNGTIDKFIGDAIMAFWGAPVPDPDHALNACRTAVEMQERLITLRNELKGMGLPEITVRIGLNTGMVIAGNMGSEDLFDYTVLGDAVNLASRLEGANKQFGTDIMISGFTYEKVADRVEARLLGRISVKGKTEEVEVYELTRVRKSPQDSD